MLTGISITVLVLSPFLFQGCKKKVDKGSSPITGPYIRATLDGSEYWMSVSAGGIDRNGILGIGGPASDGRYLYIYLSDAANRNTGMNNAFPLFPLIMNISLDRMMFLVPLIPEVLLQLLFPDIILPTEPSKAHFREM